MKLKLLFALPVIVLFSACTTTERMSKNEWNDAARTEKSTLYKSIPDRPLSLEDAYSHALMNNQDIKTKFLEKEIAEGDKLYANIDYLPQVRLNLIDTNRDTLRLSTSTRLGQGAIPGVDTVPSYSSLKDEQNASLRMSWDLLNVARNFLTHKQKGNEQYIAELNYERAAQNAFRDVFPNYTLNALLQSDGKQLEQTAKELSFEIDNVCSKILDEVSVDESLVTSCTQSLETVSNVSAIMDKLYQAELNLKALMSVSPSTNLTLVSPIYTDPGDLNITTKELIDYAVTNRPELGVELYRERNAKLEKKKAWVDIFPSVEIGYSKSDTDNPFVVNQDWEESSFNITWNLISKVIGAPFRAKQAERKSLLAKSRYRALLITTITQIELAHPLFESSRDRWLNSRKIAKISKKQLQKKNTLFANNQISKVEFLKSKIDSIQHQLQAGVDYGKMIDAMAMLYLSAGIPLTPSMEQAKSQDELIKAVGWKLRELSIVSEHIH